VDTQILGPVQPGEELRGEVRVRGGDRETLTNHVYLNVKVRCGERDSEERDYQVETAATKESCSTVRKGEEHRFTFVERLPWETPVSELGGRALGVVLTVQSDLSVGDDWDRVEDVGNDLLHVSALPLHEAVLDAFVEEGYFCDSAYVVDSCIPGAEQHHGFFQTFVLADRAPGPGRPEQLEAVFHTNAVGAMIHVRRAALDVRDWSRKPPARRFPAAHHEVGNVDWRPQVRRTLGELALLDGH
jgi:sporulation-control protein